MLHGIRIVWGLQFQPGAIDVMFQQALTFPANYMLTDQLNHILQLVCNRRFVALESRGRLSH